MTLPRVYALTALSLCGAGLQYVRSAKASALTRVLLALSVGAAAFGSLSLSSADSTGSVQVEMLLVTQCVAIGWALCWQMMEIARACRERLAGCVWSKRPLTCCACGRRCRSIALLRGHAHHYHNQRSPKMSFVLVLARELWHSVFSSAVTSAPVALCFAPLSLLAADPADIKLAIDLYSWAFALLFVPTVVFIVVAVLLEHGTHAAPPPTATSDDSCASTTDQNIALLLGLQERTGAHSAVSRAWNGPLGERKVMNLIAAFNTPRQVLYPKSSGGPATEYAVSGVEPSLASKFVLAVAPNGQLVVHMPHDGVGVLDLYGKLKWSVAGWYLSVAATDSEVVLVDRTHALRLRLHDGEITQEFAHGIDGLIAHIAVDKRGRLLCLGANDNVVHVFGADGRLQFAVGLPSSQPHTWGRITTDSQCRIIVADGVRTLTDVLVLSAEGRLESIVPANRGFCSGLSVDADDNVVAIVEHETVCAWDKHGRALEPTEQAFPSNIVAFGGRVCVYVGHNVAVPLQEAGVFHGALAPADNDNNNDD